MAHQLTLDDIIGFSKKMDEWRKSGKSYIGIKAGIAVRLNMKEMFDGNLVF